MTPPSRDHVTRLLQRWGEGEQEAMEALMPLVYGELRRLARRYLSRERPGHTLESAALVHEAYVKLIDQHRVQWRNRTHFYAIAAQTMRRILVDHARSHGYQKRGGGVRPVVLDEELKIGGEQPPDLVALDDAMKSLAEVDPEKSRLVELRFFGGLSHDEVAEVLGVSTSTAERQWRLARAWLYRALKA
ncbi:MAG: sigma-70 family RNA polymerase sigma factor [bacterium]|nr:sigma-70 family RNA polymerase sigma factor [bacterium]